ncbi:MAG TPA: hypothetical protein VGH28_17555 [Polyangiaceae bacterium]
MADAPVWTTLAAAALLAATLLVCVKRVRRGSRLGSVVVHARTLGIVAVAAVLGTLALNDASRMVAAGAVAACLTAIVLLRDLVALVVLHRTAKRARGATPPTGPLAADVPAFDYGIGDDFAVLEQAATEPYRRATRAHRVFLGSASDALGAARRAWLLECLVVGTLAGVLFIGSRARPLAKRIAVVDAIASTPEPELTEVWSTTSDGDARLLGAKRGHATVALSSTTPPAWSLRTVDLAASAESNRWDAGLAQAALWTGLHTSDGFHAIDHAFDDDLAHYADVIARGTHGEDGRVAVSADSIVYARRDTDGVATQLWIARRDGHGAHPLDPHHAGSARAAFSADYKKLAWLAWTERVASEGYSLVVARGDGSEQRVTMNDVADFGWSADGTLVAHTMDHDRECIIAPPALRHCITSARLGTLFWDAGRLTVAWVGFAGNSLAYEWIRIATGEVLAHGAVPDGNAYADAMLDSGEQPALFVVAGRGSPTSFALERVDLRTQAIADVVPRGEYQPPASGGGMLARADDGDLLFLERHAKRVRLMRLRIGARQ